MNQAREDIAQTFGGVTAYATAFDASLFSSTGEEVRVIILDAETTTVPPVRLAYAIGKTESGTFTKVIDAIIGLPTTQEPIINS